MRPKPIVIPAVLDAEFARQYQAAAPALAQRLLDLAVRRSPSSGRYGAGENRGRRYGNNSGGTWTKHRESITTRRGG